MMANAIPGPESLGALAARWRDAMRDADCGPLAIAVDVVGVAERWKDFGAETAGKRVTTWLREQFGDGRSLAWWRVRARAVTEIDESVRRTFHHETAKYVVNSVEQAHWKRIVFELAKKKKANGGNVATHAAALRIIASIAGKKPKPRQCTRCSELEALLTKHGVALKE